MKTEYQIPEICLIFCEQDLLTESRENVRLAPGEYGVEDFFR